MLSVVHDNGGGDERGVAGSDAVIDELVREGARRMLAEALQAEVDEYIDRHADQCDEQGRRLAVRTARMLLGRCPPRRDRWK